MMHGMKSVLAGLGVTLGLSAAWAGSKTGPTYEIYADIAGHSGSVEMVSAGGFRLNSTIGVNLGSQKLFSLAGTVVLPGLWSGPGYFAHTTEAYLPFGDFTQVASVRISANALPEDFLILISTSALDQPIYASPVLIDQATANLARGGNPYTYPLNSRIWEVAIRYLNGIRHTATFETEGVISLPYADEDSDGMVDGTVPPVRADTLAVWWLDEEHALWVKLPKGQVDKSAKMVSGSFRRLAIFTVMGTPSFTVGNVFAFPNPWRPEGPNAGAANGQTGTLQGGVTFSNLPSLGRIRIYTLAGNLVREIDHRDGTAQEKWDGKTTAGQDAATGTYLYTVDSNENTTHGKVVIIR